MPIFNNKDKEDEPAKEKEVARGGGLLKNHNEWKCPLDLKMQKSLVTLGKPV